MVVRKTMESTHITHAICLIPFTGSCFYILFSSNRDGDGLYALPLQPVDVRADDGETTLGKLDNVKIEIDFFDLKTFNNSSNNQFQSIP